MRPRMPPGSAGVQTQSVPSGFLTLHVIYAKSYAAWREGNRITKNLNFKSRAEPGMEKQRDYRSYNSLYHPLLGLLAFVLQSHLLVWIILCREKNKIFPQ